MMARIEFDVTDKDGLERELRRRAREQLTTLYTEQEVMKLIQAYEEKYNISCCDGVPYIMKPLLIKLSGKMEN